jgi:hypothetical protein
LRCSSPVVRLLALLLLLVACAPPGQTPRPSPSAGTSECGTPVLRGQQPGWLVDAGAANNPRDVPFVIASPPLAAGFLFGYPLTAGRTNPSNKILWVVGKPRASSSLDITARSEGVSVKESVPPDSGPGEIYPSIVDVPRAGCWHIELRWAGNTAALDLLYR